MSEYRWIIDAGHGGIDPKGNYTTAPSKMFTYPEFTIYEGVVNRHIADFVIEGLISDGIDFSRVYHPFLDTPKRERVLMANALHAKYKNCIFLSIHSNAGGGTGFEIFTSRGKTKSDDIAEIFCDIYKRSFPEYHFRQDTTDGDSDKEADYTVLKETRCPAVLFENLFFDKRSEAEFLLSANGQQRIADAIIDGVKTIEQFKTI